MHLIGRKTKRRAGEKVYILLSSEHGKALSLYEGEVLGEHPTMKDNYEVEYTKMIIESKGRNYDRTGSTGTFSADWISSSIEECLEEYDQAYNHIPYKLFIDSMFKSHLRLE